MPAKPPPLPSDTPEPGDGPSVARDGACTQAANCAAITGRWLNHLDKAGQTTTRHEDDGSFWNRKCGATSCNVRTYR